MSCSSEVRSTCASHADRDIVEEQAEKFIDYWTRVKRENPEADFLEIFNFWADSKDFSSETRREIFSIACQSLREEA